MSEEEFKLGEKETDYLLQLMSIYLSEWDHRATALWNQVFKYFYATLVVLFLPNLPDFYPPNFPKVYFAYAALLLSGVFLYVSIGCAKRAKDIGNKYKNLVAQLPEKLRRVSELDTKQNPVKQKPEESLPDSKWWEFFYTNMSYVICWLMFFALYFLSLIMIVYYLKNAG